MRDMEKDRECVQSIVAWPWIINSLMKLEFRVSPLKEKITQR